MASSNDFEAYDFDPIEELGLDIPKKLRQEALEAAAAYLKEAMLERIGRGNASSSPVSGGKWYPGLSKAYKEYKSQFSSVTTANLELNGDLLDSLTVDASSKGITIDVGSDQYGKAEGHITGLYGSNSSIRPRQFMPQPGQHFKRDIMSELKKILQEYEDNG